MKGGKVMKVRKLICMLLTLTLLFSSNVYAGEQETVSGPQLRYTNFSLISSGLSISNGTAICDGSYSMVKSYSSEMIMTLQRRPKSGSSAFSTYKEWIDTNSGRGQFAMEKFQSVPKGYDYRLRVVVKVHSAGSVIEAAACYSHTVTY